MTFQSTVFRVSVLLAGTTFHVHNTEETWGFTFQQFLAPHKFFQIQWFSCWSKLTCPKRHYLAVLLISSRLMCHESFQEKLPTSTNQEMACPQAHACMLCAKRLRCCCPKKWGQPQSDKNSFLTIHIALFADQTPHFTSS